MALKFKSPFGIGTSLGIIESRKLRDSLQRDRQRLKEFRKLQNKPRKKIKLRTRV